MYSEKERLEITNIATAKMIVFIARRYIGLSFFAMRLINCSTGWLFSKTNKIVDEITVFKEIWLDDDGGVNCSGGGGKDEGDDGDTGDRDGDETTAVFVSSVKSSRGYKSSIIFFSLNVNLASSHGKVSNESPVVVSVNFAFGILFK